MKANLTPLDPSTDVILRLADFDTALSPGGSRGRDAARVRASGLRGASRPPKNRPGGRRRNRAGFVASGQAPWAWRLPVSGARDIETSLDGRKAPLSIEPGGAEGELAIPSAGTQSSL